MMHNLNRKLLLSLFIVAVVAAFTACSTQRNAPEALAEELEVAATALTVKVSKPSSGRSIRYIGVNYGSALPQVNDLRELGVTSYRLLGGMARFEPADDDGKYGLPTISDMKRTLSSNPSRVGNFVNLAAFDRNMAGMGVALKTLYKVPGMEPLMILRNSEPRGGAPFWMPRMNTTGTGCKTASGQTIVWPQFTQADWNEWWQHVFAVVYWINVRNGSQMRVDRWAVHNEPNQQSSTVSQGWCGTTEQYLEFIKYTRDAIDFVYKTYLGNRARYVHGGNLMAGRSVDTWARPMLRNGSGSSFAHRNFYQPSMISSINVHKFGNYFGRMMSRVRSLTRESGTVSYAQNMPIWSTEMGGRWDNQWDNTSRIVNHLVNSLIEGSTPGSSHVEGALVWRLYDSHADRQGLIRLNGSRRPGFYALRLATMALNGGKQVHPTSTGNSNVRAITTREPSGGYNLLLTNRSTSAAYAVNADVSALLASGNARIYLFNNSRKGPSSVQPLTSAKFRNGRMPVNLPPLSVVLVHFY
jgi:hypothetical protein